MLNPGYKISYLIYPGYKISYLWSTSDTRYPTNQSILDIKYPIWSTLDTRYPTYALSWMNGWERHWFKLILFTGSRRWIFSKKSVNCFIWNKKIITFCRCRNSSNCAINIPDTCTLLNQIFYTRIISFWDSRRNFKYFN